MIHGVKDNPVDECFTVSDADGHLVTGIDTTGFIAYVYNPSGTEVSSLVSGSFTELGNGSYKFTFTPNLNGGWYVNVIHATYFPWGKNDDVYVDTSDLSGIYEIVIRTLGLAHQNIFIDEPVYGDYGALISARVRLYDLAVNVGTSVGVIETYKIEADELASGQFTFWKQYVSA